MSSNSESLNRFSGVNTRLAVHYSALASAFFGIGIVIILIEALFFDYFQNLANAAFSTRAIIGFHLFPSEIWFIFFGNALVFLAIANNDFLIPGHLAPNARPAFLILTVYTLWFVYGALAGNSWALQEFREMVFTAFSLPAILYFAPFVSANQVMRRFCIPTVLALLVFSIGYATNTALIIGTFFVAYFCLRLLYRNGWAVFGLGIAALPFVIKFSKPMIVLLAFCLAASFLLAGYLNPKSVNLIFSRFKLRILFVAFALVMLLVAVIVAINALTGGAVEDIIRWYFLKQRVSASGAIVYADISGGRLAIWRVALESWSQRPLFGYGLGAELEAYSKGWVVKTQFHSYLVQALHNTGLVGLFLICSGWLVWTLRSLRRVYRVGDMDEKIILGSMLVYVFGIAFYGMFGHSLSYPPSTQFFWLCIGFLSVRRRPRSLRVHA